MLENLESMMESKNNLQLQCESLQYEWHVNIDRVLISPVTSCMWDIQFSSEHAM